MSEMNENSKVSLHRYGPAAGLIGLIGVVALLGGAMLSKETAAWQAYLCLLYTSDAADEL